MNLDLGSFTVEIGRMFKQPNGALSRRKTGTRTGAVTATIDPARLGYLARKALGSKGGRATALHGAIVLKVGNVSESRLNLNDYGDPA